MATSVGSVLGSIAGSAASGATGGVGVIMGAINDIIGKFITDPNAKLAATQHALDVQSQLQLAALDAETKQAVSANDAAKNDHYLGGARAAFCYGFTALYLFNYSGIAHRLGLAPMDIPANLNFIFAGVMLGCIGIPAMIEGLQNILKMPGDSTVKVPGLMASNKS
jgi:hypothetical protein